MTMMTRPTTCPFPLSVVQRLVYRRLSHWKHIRCFSESGNGRKPPAKSLIPTPTWSVDSLELGKKHPPVSQQELQQLSKRALLDTRHLPVSELRQDLGNMLHMIRQVQSFQPSEELSDVDLYDVPRGVKATPLRKDDKEGDKRNVKEEKQVWESFLKPKTTSVGAHSYFVIATRKGKK